MTAREVKELFDRLRFDPAHHLGAGDIRLTIGQQDEIVSALSHVAPNCPYRSYKDHDPANCGHCSSPSTTPRRGDYRLVRSDVLAWLHGEAAHPDSGEWFERPEGKGAYWWRSKLRDATLESAEVVMTQEVYEEFLGYRAECLLRKGSAASATPLFQKIPPACRASSVEMKIAGASWACMTCGASNISPECRFRRADGGNDHGT